MGPGSCVAPSLLLDAGAPMGAWQVGQRVLLGVLCWGCLAALPALKPADSVLLPWHWGHPGVPSFSWGAGAAGGITAWYHVPVYCPRNVTTPGGLPGLFRGEGAAWGPEGEGSEAEESEAGWDPVGPSPGLRSSSGLSRGSDADLPLLVGATLGAALPRTGGLSSPEDAASLGDNGLLATGCLLAGVAFPWGWVRERRRLSSSLRWSCHTSSRSARMAWSRSRREPSRLQ